MTIVDHTSSSVGKIFSLHFSPSLVMNKVIGVFHFPKIFLIIGPIAFLCLRDYIYSMLETTHQISHFLLYQL